MDLALQSYSTTDQINDTYYDKTETDNLLTNKVSSIGDVSLTGHLDIGTTYTNSRIRCNAEVNGHTGYAELHAQSSCDMYLNLSTTYPNGGWMYFKINNDNYMQLSGSDNQVNIYKDTTINGILDVGVSASSSTIDAHSNQQGYAAITELHSQSPWINKLEL